MSRERLDLVKRERHAPDYVLLLAVAGLVAIGILMVYSSSAIRGYIVADDTLAYVGPQALWVVLGGVALVITSRLDYRYGRVVSIPLYGIALVLLVLVLLPGVGRVVGGAARWLALGPLPPVHPAEFAKLALVIYLAHWLATRGQRVSGFRTGILPFLVITLPIVLLVVREPDLGTSAVLLGAATVMLFSAGANVLWLAALAPAALAGIAWVISSNAYQRARIVGFLDPWSDPQGLGFHTIQGLLALALGGIVGSGLGSSLQVAGLYLPNAWNDFIFAIIGEELGFAGGLLVIVLFLIVGYRGMRVALGAPDTFGGLLAAGITVVIVVQAFVNIGVVLALLPVTGITLPFVSAGGSSLIVSLAAVGILLSISRETAPRRNWVDARADRGGRDRGTRVPRPGRRPVTSGAPGRA
jgi:cell division protein FtsW